MHSLLPLTENNDNQSEAATQKSRRRLWHGEAIGRKRYAVTGLPISEVANAGITLPHEEVVPIDVAICVEVAGKCCYDFQADKCFAIN